MGILDSIVEWIATQVMNLLDLITGSVLGALGCDMSTFLRYFPAAETLYEIFVAIGVGFILLNLVWQLFRNFGLGLGLSAEDPVKLAIKSILFIFLALFADQIMVLVLGIVGTPYDWVVDTALPPIEFASFASVVTVFGGQPCVRLGKFDCTHFGAHRSMELYQASIRGSGEIHSRRRSDLHSSSRIRYRGIRKHIKCL